MPASSVLHHNHHSHHHHHAKQMDDFSLQFTNQMIISSPTPTPTPPPTTSNTSNGSKIEEMMALRGLKTSQNITESVPVPTSEHVAEIVGRQGCKIKALRAKTNTYIKTPIRGEAPMFVITGRKEDVLTAKREIQLAADHFSQIRARRGSSSSSSSGGSGGNTTTSIINNTSNNVLISPSSPSVLVSTPIKLAEQAVQPSATNSSSPKLIIQNHVTSSSSSSSSSSSCASSMSPPVLIDSSLTAKPVLASCSTTSINRSNSTSPKTIQTQNTVIDQSLSSYSSFSSSSSPMSPLDKNQASSPSSLSSSSHTTLTQQRHQLTPGQIVKKVTVPYQVVGLVVGPKGSTIKRIQQNTNTYIVTPSRDSQPIFEIQGLSDNVEAAKIEIENYIMLRTASTTSNSSHLVAQQSVSSPIASGSSNMYQGAYSSSLSSSSSSSTSSSNDYTQNGNLLLNPGLLNKYNQDPYSNTDLLLSPKTSSLFQSVVSVVDDFIPNSQQAQPDNGTSIWSSSTYSTSPYNTSTNEEFLVNSLQKVMLNNDAPSDSFLTEQNQLYDFGSCLDNKNNFLYNQPQNVNLTADQFLNSIVNNALSHQQQQQQLGLQYPSQNDIILNSIFQHENLSSQDDYQLNQYNHHQNDIMSFYYSNTNNISSSTNTLSNDDE